MNSSAKVVPGHSWAQPATSAARWSVRTFLIILVLSCLLPGTFGAAGLFAYQYLEARVQRENDTTRTARALVHALDNHLLRAQAVVQTLSTADALLRQDFERFHLQARKALALSGLGSNIVLRDEAGRQILNTALDFGQPLPAQLAPEQVRDVFVTGKPTVSPVFVGPVLKRPIMSVDVPVTINGETVFALGIGILPEQLNALLKAQSLPAGWIAVVLDSTGTIAGRTHLPEQFVGNKANRRLLQAMEASPEGSIQGTTGEGIPVQTSYSRSPVTHWAVAIGIPRHIIYSALWQTLSLLGLEVLALIGISLVLARFISRRIAHSVTALMTPAIALGEGGFVRIPEVDTKEAAEVAQALGRAAALLQERASELAEAHRLAKFGSWYWNLVTNEIRTSDSLREIFGRAPTSFTEMRGSILPPESWEQLNAAMQEAIRLGKGYSLEIEPNDSGGQRFWINAKGEPVVNEHGAVIALRGMVQDITERIRSDQLLRESEEKLRNAALHDVLTGLPNRALVMEFCERLVGAARRGHGGGALLFIDLDRFKPINDLYGHEVGDHVLQEVGCRLLACTRQEDLVGRLGGDEFVIVLPHADRAPHRAAVVAQHVIATVSRPIRLNALELFVSSSIGISLVPEHATSVSALIHAADLAMYQAKQLGRANYQFYTLDLEQHSDQILSVEARLKTTLSRGGLELHYQPVIDVKSGQLIGAEALLRLNDGGETIGPDRFIPIAESAGLIGALGEWVVAEACRQHAEWRSCGLPLTIAINVSPLQFKQRTFAEKLGEIIAAERIDPGYLEIEITESAVMAHIDEAIGILNRIKSLGVQVALDDFGTGYSSLSRLTSLPLDKLKVDQSFVRRIERDPACRTVTEAIIGLAKSLKLTVHAEGIESEEALQYLDEHGCNQAQGYWFSKPLPPTEFVRWCREHRSVTKPLNGRILSA